VPSLIEISPVASHYDPGDDGEAQNPIDVRIQVRGARSALSEVMWGSIADIHSSVTG
jgi:hypothetical protein